MNWATVFGVLKQVFWPRAITTWMVLVPTDLTVKPAVFMARATGQ